MVKRIIQLQDISGVSAGGTAIVNCPVGYRYHDINLVLTGGADLTVATAFGTISAKLGGKVQRRATAEHIDAINTLQGAGYAAYTQGSSTSEVYHLPIFFAEPWRKRTVDQDALAWQTGWLGKTGTFQLEVGIGSGTSSPKLAAFATVDDFDSGKPHGIMKWYSYNDSASDPESFVNLDKRDFYSQISLWPGNSVYASEVSLRIGGVELIQKWTAHQIYTWLLRRGMNATAPANGVPTHLVFDADDQLDDVVPAEGANSIILDIDWSGAPGSKTIVAQRFGLPD
jgi:hypothetical protein